MASEKLSQLEVIDRVAKKIYTNDYEGENLLYLDTDEEGTREAGGSFYRWGSKVWELLSRNELRKQVEEHLLLNSNGRREAIARLSFQAEIPNTHMMNTRKHKINLENGVYNLSNWKFGRGQFERTDYSTILLPFGYEEDASIVGWLEFLNEIFPSQRDKSQIPILQEWFGYLLLPSTQYHKALILLGDGGNGKSVVLKVAQALIGKANYETVSLEDLGKETYLYVLQDKLVNFCDETDIEAGVLETKNIKRLISGEELEAKKLFKMPGKIHPFVRLMVSANRFPKVRDNTHGLWRRLLLIQFNYKVPDEKIVPDIEKQYISEELPGIFNWALEGLKRLRARGRFDESTYMQQKLTQQRLNSNSPSLFVADRILPNMAILGGSPTLKTKSYNNDELYDSYRVWAYSSNLKPFSKIKFTVNLMNTYEKGLHIGDGIKIKTTRTRTTSGRMINFEIKLPPRKKIRGSLGETEDDLPVGMIQNIFDIEE